MDLNKTHDSFLFFILIILGRYLGTNIDCETRDVLNNNIIARQILLYFFILVAISFRVEKIDSIFSQIASATQIWFISLLFTKLDIYSMIGVLSLFTMAKLLEKKQFNSDDNKNMFEITESSKGRVIKILRILSYFILFAGFTKSYLQKDKGDDFSHVKYVFGGYGCHKL